MNNITLFEYESHEIRVIQDDNKGPWWVAGDVCDILGISNVPDAMNRLDEDEKSTIVLTDRTSPKGGNPNVNVINEPGLYNLIINSKKPEANKFRRWITHEVLPSIRKTGSYSMSKEKPISFVKVAKEFKAAASMAKTAGLTGNQAILSANMATFKITGYDCLDILGTPKLICEKQEIHLTASDLGKLLNNMSAQQTNKLLQSQGLISSWRDHKNQQHWKPTEKGKPYTVLKDVGKSHGDGTPVQQLMYLESILDALEPEKMTSH